MIGKGSDSVKYSKAGRLEGREGLASPTSRMHIAAMLISALAVVALSACHATDGDSIRCDGERLRLLAIDADLPPESSLIVM